MTGLYLLLLLTKGDYAGFHTVLEGLEVEMGGGGGSKGAGAGGLEEDRFIGYPVKLERWLMEGSYDRVWGATKREGVPGEEFGVFSEVCGWGLDLSAFACLLGALLFLLTLTRSSLALSVRKSLPALKKLTRLSPLRMRRTCFSSRVKVAWWSLRRAGDGWCRMVGYTSRCSKVRV